MFHLVNLHTVVYRKSLTCGQNDQLGVLGRKHKEKTNILSEKPSAMMYSVSFSDLKGENSDQTFQRFASAAAFIANFMLLGHDILHATRSITCLNKSLNVIFGYIQI